MDSHFYFVLRETILKSHPNSKKTMLVKPPPTTVIQHWMECLVAVSRWLWLHLDLLLCAARRCSRLYKGPVKTDP